MKQLFLLRHGNAVAFAPTDAQRSLSDRGFAEVGSTLEQAAPQLMDIDEVWVSPYLRAQQTWQQASLALKSHPDCLVSNAVVTHKGITPDGSIRDVLNQLEHFYKTSKMHKLLLVTHQPFVGELLESLCGFDSGRHFLGTAHLAAINIPVTENGSAVLATGLGELKWIKQPLI